MSSNYPPGVTGNEPQISGVWPVDEVIDHLNRKLTDIGEELEEVWNEADDLLEPHGGAGKLGDLIAKAIDTVKEAAQEAQMPEEPGL